MSRKAVIAAVAVLALVLLVAGGASARKLAPVLIDPYDTSRSLPVLGPNQIYEWVDWSYTETTSIDSGCANAVSVALGAATSAVTGLITLPAGPAGVAISAGVGALTTVVTNAVTAWASTTTSVQYTSPVLTKHARFVPK